MPVLAVLALFCGFGSLKAQTAVYSGSTSTFDGTDFSNPQGIATDAAGDVFIANNGGTLGIGVFEMTRTGPGVYSAPVLLPNPSPGYVFIRGIVIDSLGNLWVADNANGSGGQVYESINTAGSFGTPTKVGTGWTAPWGMAADTAGNVYVADNGANAIVEISGGVKTVLNTGSVNQPRGIAIDAGGNIFALDGSIFQVEKLASPYTSATNVNSTVLSGAGDIAMDASGNIWVANYGSNMVNELTAASGYLTIQNWGALNGPVAVWPDADGTWLVSEYNDNAIRQVATGPINMGTVAVNSTSGTQTLSFTFTGAGSTTILAPAAVTLGATGQDYIDAGGGTCAAGTFASGSSCTVNVSLKPKHAGPLYGAVNLVDAGNNVLASNLFFGVGSGPQVAFPGSTAIQTLGGGFTMNIRAVAADGAGNLYVADKSSTGILKVPVGCTDSSCVVTLGAGLSSPTGVALDGSGNIYIADSGNSAVKEMPANCTSSICVTTLGAGFITPQGVAVDGVGNVYVADNGNNAVDEMPAGCASGGCVTPLGSGLGSPTSVAVDGSGNVYAAGSGYVKEMTPGCNSGLCVTTLGAGFNTPVGIAVDAGGNVYVSDYGTNLITDMPAGCSSSTCVATLGTGFSSPAGIALDGSGNVYVGDSGNSAVKKLSLTTPPGLSFASTKAGTQSTDSPQTVGLANIGNAALSFPVPATGTNPSVAANFSLDASTTCPQLTTSSSSPGTLASGATCNLELDFVPITIGSISGQAVLTDDNLNANPTVTQSIGLSGSANSPIVPYVRVNGKGWQQIPNVTVNAGDTVDLATMPFTGTWSWTGPNGFTASTREIDAVALPSGTNVFTATYTDASSNTSTLSITITVNSTSVLPYVQINGGGWQQMSSATVNVGDTVNLGGQLLSTGTYSWTGPNGFSASTRVINGISLTSPTNTYTLTYTNSSAVQTVLAFNIRVNSTPIVPYVQVNGGGWQQTATPSVNAGDTVNLAGQLQSTGTWSWSGPNGATASGRIVSGIPLTTATSSYTLTYTNAAGVQSTQVFTVTVKPTTIVPSIQVNTGAYQQVATVTVNAGDTVNLNPTAGTGGTWSWSGPGGFTSASRMLSGVALTSASNVYTATYTNTAGVQSTQAFTLNVSSTPTPITPYIQVNGGGWQKVSSVTINAGDTVNLGGSPFNGGSWSWSGPSGFAATGRVISASTLTSASNVYTATYTNIVGVNSTQNFTIHVNSTPIVPYIQVNGGGWQQLSSVTVNATDTVNLAGQQLSTGTWHWTGASGYSASTRIINAVPLTSATTTFTLTYTNADGVQSTQAFTIHVNSTPIVPYLQVNGGAWQHPVSTVTVNAGDTVTLAGQSLSTGTWHWTGPGGFTASTRTITAPLNSATNAFTLTYTNSANVQSTQSFTVTVRSTPIVPYIQVSGGGWQQKSTASVTTGATVNLAGQLQSTGTWSWVGPGGYTASGRIASAVPLTSGANNFTLTYTNSSNVQSTQVFTITLN